MLFHELGYPRILVAPTTAMSMSLVSRFMQARCVAEVEHATCGIKRVRRALPLEMGGDAASSYTPDFRISVHMLSLNLPRLYQRGNL